MRLATGDAESTAGKRSDVHDRTSHQHASRTDEESVPAGSPRQGAKIWGIFLLLVAICLYTALSSDRFLRVGNIENLVHRTALFGILSIGAAFVIITGGIDLSIGSLVCLVGVLLPYLLIEHGWPVAAGVATVLGMSVAIGVIHGLLITKMRLQPFVVTLCGLLALPRHRARHHRRPVAGLRRSIQRPAANRHRAACPSSAPATMCFTCRPRR